MNWWGIGFICFLFICMIAGYILDGKAERIDAEDVDWARHYREAIEHARHVRLLEKERRPYDWSEDAD